MEIGNNNQWTSFWHGSEDSHEKSFAIKMLIDILLIEIKNKSSDQTMRVLFWLVDVSISGMLFAELHNSPFFYHLVHGNDIKSLVMLNKSHRHHNKAHRFKQTKLHWFCVHSNMSIQVQDHI